MSLVDSRVSTDKALLLYQLVTSRLHHRLAQQHHLQDTLSELQEQRRQVGLLAHVRLSFCFENTRFEE